MTITEESYTSKCDALAMEEIGKHEEYKGKRKKRGLYQSSIGKLINADINGASNIIRKEYPNAFNNLDLRYLYETTTVVTYKDLCK